MHTNQYIVIKDSFDTLDLFFYVVQEYDGKVFIASVDKCGEDVCLKFGTEDQAGKYLPPPTFSIPRTHREQFFKAVSDYMNAHKINTESESTSKGKLIATEKHLEDMRKITMSMLKIKN